MTLLYSIVFRASALKDVRRIPGSILESIQKHIAALKNNPVPRGAIAISGYLHHYRIRIGSYRVVYEVAKEIRIITIVKIGHRKDIYKNL